MESKSTTIYLIIIMLIALILRAFHLNFDGLWNDEIYTAYTASPKLSFGDVYHFTIHDIHPPLHHFINKIWCMIIGHNDLSIRVLNMVFGFFAVLSVYHLTKLIFTKRTAFYAALLAAVNFYLIKYSQEVRPYSMLILLTNFSFYYFVLLVRDGYQKVRAIRYVVITTFMLYTHYFALFLVGGQFIAFLFLIDWSEFRDKWKKYLITFTLPNLLFLFWIPIIIRG